MREISKVKMMIQSYIPSLTKSEKKIAAYILEKYTEVMYLSVTELAESAGVGETTVFRLCKKLGFKGYPELKLVIAQDNVDLQEKNQDPTDVHYSEGIKNNIINKISECYELLEQEELDEAIRLLSQANRICFFGMGSSGISAETAQERFIRMGIPTDIALQGHRQSMMASILSHEDVIVAFSISGTTKDVVDALEIAKSNHIKIIVVTSYLKSPITQYADVLLMTAGKENLIEGGTLASSISQLFIVDVLVTGIALLDSDKTFRMREKTGRALLEKI